MRKMALCFSQERFTKKNSRLLDVSKKTSMWTSNSPLVKTGTLKLDVDEEEVDEEAGAATEVAAEEEAERGATRSVT